MKKQTVDGEVAGDGQKVLKVFEIQGLAGLVAETLVAQLVDDEATKASLEQDLQGVWGS